MPIIRINLWISAKNESSTLRGSTMKQLAVLILLMMTAGALAQDTTAVPPPPPPQPVETEETTPSKVFYGGTLGVSFGDYFRLSVQPMVGYNLSPRFSAGVKAIYEYISDTRTAQTFTWHNFGGSVFGRFHIVPQAYAHAEFAYMSYDSPIERYGVPFLLLGGGYVQRISSNAGLYVEVLFDVLQDDKSPYESGTPFISIGAAVGI
jgi:hypothetical protein